MLDTVQLSLQDFDLTNAKLRLRPATIDMETGATVNEFPLWHNGAQQVVGADAFRNDGICNVHVKPMPSCDGTPNPPACFVNFEVPKVEHGHNYHLLDRQGVGDALMIVQAELKRMGIKCNIKDAKVSRADICRNVTTKEPCESYQRVFQVLKCKRSQKREEANGFLYFNGNREHSFYDKIEQMRYKKHSTQGLPKRSMRAELRLKKSAVVKATLGLETVRDVMKEFGAIHQVYVTSMEESLFKYSPHEVECLMADDIATDMRHFKEIHGRQWLQMYLQAYGLFSLMEKTSMELVIEVVKDLSDNRMQASRVSNKLQQLRANTELSQTMSGNKRTTGELYRELKDKILA
jgi:hypothetical protein